MEKGESMSPWCWGAFWQRILRKERRTQTYSCGSFTAPYSGMIIVSTGHHLSLSLFSQPGASEIKTKYNKTKNNKNEKWWSTDSEWRSPIWGEKATSQMERTILLYREHGMRCFRIHTQECGTQSRKRNSSLSRRKCWLILYIRRTDASVAQQYFFGRVEQLQNNMVLA